MSHNVKDTPAAFKILLAVCLLIVGVMIYSFIRRLPFSQNVLDQIIRIVLWVAVCVGFYFKRKWAWAIFSVLLIFSILNVIHAVLSLRMSLNLAPFISIAVGVAVLWLLNRTSIRELFQVDLYDHQEMPREIANFAVLCLAIGLFVIVEILGISRIATSSIPAKLFLGGIGLCYMLLGIGIWRLNKYAFQAVLSLLIFSLISITIILVYDFIKANRFMALNKSMYYILLNVALLMYWIKSLRPKLSDKIQIE